MANQTETMAVEPEQQGVVTPFALTGPVVTIPLADITSDAYGVGKRYNITLADIQGLGAVLQGNFLLDNLPPGEIMTALRIKHSQSVAGPSITACTAQVTDNINAAFGSAFDVFQAVSNTALSTVQLTAANAGNWAAVTPIYLTLIATGANLGVATAGAINVWLRYAVLGSGAG